VTTKLTDAAAAKLTLPSGRGEAFLWDSDIPGFGARLRAGSRPVWCFQFRFARRTRRITIGNVSAIRATDARSTASKFYAMVKLGQDPSAAKREAIAAQDETVGAVIDVYLERQRMRLRPRSFSEVRRHLLAHAKSLHRLQLTGVDRRAVAGLVAQLGVSNGQTVANATLKDLSAFYAWAMREGLADKNPAAGANRFPERSRDHLLTNAEIKAIWKATADDNPHSALVRLLMLLGCRRQELGLLRWDEVYLDVGTIALPPARTKNARPHVIPLPALAIAILKTQPRDGDYVFGARGVSSWSRGKRALDQRSGVADWRVHDLRRVVSTRLHQDLLQPPHLIEAILGHVQPGIAATYNRADYLNERRCVLDMWAEHLLALVEDRPAKVVALRS